MKSNLGTVLLALLAVGLVIALITIRHQADEKQRNDAAAILDFSNQLTKASLNVDELRQVNLLLNNNLATNRDLLTDLSNSLITASETVTNVHNSLLAAQDQVATQGARIADLQQQNKELNDRATELTADEAVLTNKLAQLNDQISSTTRELATSKTNNVFLEKQLQQLIEARAELEHKFNTLADVRAQLQKLHDDLFTSRRLQWIRDGSLQQLKGAQLMMQARDRYTESPSAPATNYGLNVVMGTDGSIKALPPAKSITGTNVPAQ